MFRIQFSTILLIIFSYSLSAKVKLTENAKVSILTCSQGEELYSAFGHSALRVTDPQNNVDWVFNYGTFDFNTPNFYLKFANGKLNYILSISEFNRFLPEYFENNRNVIEQVLNLNQRDKQNVFDALMVNYKPENRFYKYDFFYDNCATRIYDIIADNIEGEIIVGIQQEADNKKVSFREYLHHYLVHSPWIETGLNIILGLPADKTATLKESTYLPDFLMSVMDNALYNTKSGEKIPLVQKKEPLLEFDLNLDNNSYKLTPSILFWGLLIMVVILTFIVKSKLSIILDKILFLTVGMVGLLISYLWFVTDHSVTGYNFNILWSIPTFIYLAFFNSKKSAYLVVLKINTVFIIIFLAGWVIIPQAFPLATIPIALLIGFRLFVVLNKLKVANLST